MQKKLILITTIFPFGKSEPYLYDELSKIPDFFDEIDIFSLSVRKSDEINEIESSIKVFPIYFKSYLFYLIYAITALFTKEFYREIIRLIKNDNFNLMKLKKLLIYISRSNYEFSKIYKKLKNDRDSQFYFYSYRFEYQAYIAAKLKQKFKNSKLICRAHGYDLYEEANNFGYIPLQAYILENSDKVFPVSLYGKEYLLSKFRNYEEKIQVSYLGTLDSGKCVNYNNKETFKIVSCSNVFTGKRLDRIVNVLMGLGESKKIIWTHFGDGPELAKIQMMSKQLPNNVETNFVGYIPNNKILKKYLVEQYDLFVSLSDSEGVPVSMMEALSFGIPILSTAVGGVPEIVKDGFNGFLVDKENSGKQICLLIKKMMLMSEEEIIKFRENSRILWEQKFYADRNYNDFYNKIIFEL